MKRITATAAFVVLACIGANAYALWGVVWRTSSVTMQLQLGSSGGPLLDGSPGWGESAEAALATWNQYLSRVRFLVVRGSTAPIAQYNGFNNVFWSSTVYGYAFGTGVIAVTTNDSVGSSRLEADVVFNDAYLWNSYSGPTRYTSYGEAIYDVRRVALHEFGHVLGLDHPDDFGQRVSAIMNSHVGDLDHLEADDIAGASLIDSMSGPTIVTAPGAPGGLVTSATGSSVTLTWRAPTSGGLPTSYIIEAGSTPGGANLANFSTGSAATTFSAGGVGAGVYFVRVRASNTAGVGPASNEAVLTVGAACSSAPSAVSALVGSVVGSTVTLNWSPASGATTYVVEAGSAPGLSNIVVSDLNTAAASYVATSVGAGTYYVRIRGKNGCGVGPPSNEITVIVR